VGYREIDNIKHKALQDRGPTHPSTSRKSHHPHYFPALRARGFCGFSTLGLGLGFSRRGSGGNGEYLTSLAPT
jgi:hypothetical protein